MRPNLQETADMVTFTEEKTSFFVPGFEQRWGVDLLDSKLKRNKAVQEKLRKVQEYNM